MMQNKQISSIRISIVSFFLASSNVTHLPHVAVKISLVATLYCASCIFSPVLGLPYFPPPETIGHIKCNLYPSTPLEFGASCASMSVCLSVCLSICLAVGQTNLEFINNGCHKYETPSPSSPLFVRLLRPSDFDSGLRNNSTKRSQNRTPTEENQ